MKPDQTKILDTLGKKCKFKGIDVPTMETLLNHPDHDELETEWENMLGHQLPALPEFEQFWNELPAILDWLHGARVEVSVPTIQIAATGALQLMKVGNHHRWPLLGVDIVQHH